MMDSSQSNRANPLYKSACNVDHPGDYHLGHHKKRVWVRARLGLGGLGLGLG